jgi:hypothetical protein
MLVVELGDVWDDELDVESDDVLDAASDSAFDVV